MPPNRPTTPLDIYRSINALAEVTIGLYKTELIHHQGPCHACTDLELATLEYIDWLNHRRVYGACGDVPPAEYEAAYWTANPTLFYTAGTQ